LLHCLKNAKFYRERYSIREEIDNYLLLVVRNSTNAFHTRGGSFLKICIARISGRRSTVYPRRVVRV